MFPPGTARTPETDDGHCPPLLFFSFRARSQFMGYGECERKHRAAFVAAEKQRTRVGFRRLAVTRKDAFSGPTQ